MPDTAMPGLADATTITKQPEPRTFVPLLDHAKKAGALQANSAARAMGNLAAGAQLAALGPDAQLFAEFMQLQNAALARLKAMQKGWAESYVAWTKYASQLKGANTMSKLVEREVNIAAQFTQLIGNQLTDLVTLEENYEVDLTYWLNTALSARKASKRSLF